MRLQKVDVNHTEVFLEGNATMGARILTRQRRGKYK